MDVNKLWYSNDENEWKCALTNYMGTIRRFKQKQIEKEFQTLKSDDVRKMSPQEFYVFLRDKYFVWKYTSYLSIRLKELNWHDNTTGLAALGRIHKELFAELDSEQDNISRLIEIASQIHGLGPAGASGLISVMFPEKFGTIDQYAVKALQRVDKLPEHKKLMQMNPPSLTAEDGVILIKIYRRKAAELNAKFGTDFWSPRLIDQILWCIGR